MRDVSYAGLSKLLVVPDGFEAPRVLTHGDLTARPLSRECLADDVRAINADRELINATRGGGWPDGPTSEEDDYIDLVWHEGEWKENKSFSYVLETPTLGYVGCAYLYPLGVRQELSEELAAYDVDVSWWVTTEAYEQGLYEVVHTALKKWVPAHYPFRRPHFSNAKVPGQA